MTTRSGASYKRIEETMSGQKELTDVLQALLEDRQLRERELVEERTRKEEELRQERLRRDEEAARREEEVRQQMELLRGLVEGVQRQGLVNAPRQENDRDVKVTKLTEEDDIEAYLTTFERLMQAYEIRRERWVYKLAPQLSGRAQQAYAAMNPEEAQEYGRLKEAILRRYDINEESYRQRVRLATRKQGETNRELAARLQDLTDKWMQGCNTMEEIKDRVVMEQRINTLPGQVRVWVKERKPTSSREAGQLADDYIQARGQDLNTLTTTESRGSGRQGAVRLCHGCGKPGHQVRDCRLKSHVAGREKDEPVRKTEKPKRDLKDIECFNCHKRGHYSSNCPHNVMFCRDRKTMESQKKNDAQENTRIARSGVVEGQTVDSILLDTGCSRTLVHQKYVPERNYLEGEAVAIRCAHGDTVLYPLAQVRIEVEGKSLEVQAAVADCLPVAVLLGTDVPQLVNLLAGEMPQASTADAMVVTRARARQQQEEEAEQQDKNRQSGVQPHVLWEESDDKLEDISVMENKSGKKKESEEDSYIEDWMVRIDEELFSGGQTRRKLTRSQKRANKKQYSEQYRDGQRKPVHGGDSNHPLDISAEDLKVLQETDPSLESIRKAADGHASTAGVGFLRKEGLLYRRWVPPGRDREDMSVDQLVLPYNCQKTVLQLAHDIPLAGHLGRDKTAGRILQRFYWPTLYRDVAEFCRSCGACQKTAQNRGKPAPLIPLPIIDVPFQRIAMDIVGPLPMSRSGKRYVLVVCDYATRYPEAIALHTIDAGHIAEELMKLFARVGVPEEILTDQGSNFTSKLLVELYRMLHVHPIRTSPYHPQTDGLVERFNQTLKAMLRKAATSEGKDWDKVLPYLLFAYREVPQASTGFSPFELLYGRAVNGPLDVLRQAWEVTKKSDDSVVSHVLSMRDKMMKMTELVKENLSNAQEKQKLWYDRAARHREFTPEDQVLVLLPTATSKLLAQWQGPYQVLRRVGKVNYLVDMHDRRKRRRIFHVNMLRPWYVPRGTGYFCEEDEVTEQEDVPVWKEVSDVNEDQPQFGKQLSEQQWAELGSLLTEFSDVMKIIPGRTNLVEHDIQTGEAHPVRLPPYRLPHAYRDPVQKEIQEMLKQRIIEPSSSAWSAPIVLVKKKDGTLRLCVDYRRLNGVSEADAYPMPRVDDLIDRLGRSCFISTMDLTRGYWQVPVTTTAKHKTAFTTPFGLYQFNVMPFGLQGAPATFQRLMDKVLQGLQDFSAAYLDDVIIFSENWKQHLQHLRQVLQSFRDAGLTVKAKKCQFGMAQCTYLGHVVGSGAVCPDPAKTEAVKSFPLPHTKKQVRAFLGLTGYYRRFIPNYSSVAVPLTDLTKKDAPSKVIWSEKCDHAFRQLKELLCNAPLLSTPDFDRSFVLQTDASERGVGAVLSQCDDEGMEHPVAYFSKKLLPREERYSTVEKECLAIRLGIQAFKVYLLGRQFEIQTDHRALVWLDRLKEHNARLTRWSLALQPYQFVVIHRPGQANGNADALSRSTPN